MDAGMHGCRPPASLLPCFLASLLPCSFASLLLCATRASMLSPCIPLVCSARIHSARTRCSSSFPSGGALHSMGRRGGCGWCAETARGGTSHPSRSDGRRSRKRSDYSAARGCASARTTSALRSCRKDWNWCAWGSPSGLRLRRGGMEISSGGGGGVGS